MSLCAQMDCVRAWPISDAGPAVKPLFWTQAVNEQESMVSDNELLRRIAAGDRPAFAEFYDRHATLMFSVACKILHDAGEAEDVLQEAFLQVWEKAGNFDPQLGKAASWAVILARNKSIDRIRASQRRARLAEAAGVEHAATGAEDTVNQAIHGREKAKLIQSAIGALPADQRRAIELAFFSGLTQNEISEELHEPLGTVKARIRRGLLKLRGALEGLL
jgi:RNA polymerase sigma-70 factor (ECF subfamily)